MPGKTQFLKTRAMTVNKSSKPSPFIEALIFVGLTMILQYLSSGLLTSRFTENGIRGYYNYFMNGNLEKALEIAENLLPSSRNVILNMIIKLVEQILSAGFVIFTVNTVRVTGQACYENILDGFGILGKLLVMLVLKTLVIGALSLLVFPGIMAAYAYSQSLYLLLDHPDWTAIQCMKESRKMMKGRKWERFGLDLSFFGWIILEMFFAPVEVFVMPYMETTRFLYYESVLSEQRGDTSYSV